MHLSRARFAIVAALLLCFAFGIGVQLGLHAFKPPAASSVVSTSTEEKDVHQQQQQQQEDKPIHLPVHNPQEQPAQPREEPPEELKPVQEQPDEQARLPPEPLQPDETPDEHEAKHNEQPPNVAPDKQTVSVVIQEVLASAEVQRLLEVAKQKLRNLSQSTSSPLISYLRDGHRLPILLLTCNRPELLKQTIESLLQTGATSNDIIVVQDGALESVAEIVRSYNLHLKQNTLPNNLRGGAAHDGAARIATNYKFAMSYAFDTMPEAPGFIIVEDDLLFSPDFYEYFHENTPLLEVDTSTMILSAWNDNGFREHVRDKFQFHRTNFFPGLGWFMSRQLYKGELESRWPTTHWDHWLRDPANHRSRESIYVQVPRDFHNGIKGTFMDDRTHNKYFKDIANNQDPDLSWAKEKEARGYPPYLLATKEVYQVRVSEMISRCKHIRAVQELFSHEDTVLCVWIDVSPHSNLRPPPFERVANFFGIWHEMRRGNYRGVHEFYWKNNNYIMLINSSNSPFAGMKPQDVSNINVREFNPSLIRSS